jgi:hypothetical protein
MSQGDPSVFERLGGEAGRKERNRERSRQARSGLLPNVLRTYSPRYTPHDIAFSAEMEAISAQFTAMATRTS